MRKEAGKLDWSKLRNGPFPASSVYKTYESWKRQGYYVMKGETAFKWDKKGRPLFNEDQVEMNIYDLDSDDYIGLGDYWFWKD